MNEEGTSELLSDESNRSGMVATEATSSRAAGAADAIETSQWRKPSERKSGGRVCMHAESESLQLECSVPSRRPSGCPCNRMEPHGTARNNM